jgi:hypothetical protein
MFFDQIILDQIGDLPPVGRAAAQNRSVGQT